jgi:hypothetical protein
MIPLLGGRRCFNKVLFRRRHHSFELSVESSTSFDSRARGIEEAILNQYTMQK